MTSTIDRQIDHLEYERQELERRIAALRRQRPRERVQDYIFRDAQGAAVSLSSLFGDKRSLVLVHNMGRGCAFCTMWADGFNGLLAHLQSRVAFVVTSPDPPAAQQAFAAGRGWKFAMYSVERSFIDDMGFVHPSEGLMPGVSTFERAPDGSVVRAGRAEFGPGDRFCATWHLFELCAEGIAEWEPQFAYDQEPHSGGSTDACSEHNAHSAV
jgi:predicted dithiol-disulfide oxidoreductase (DUF899 family)